MLPNKVKAAVMTAPGRIEAQDFPYPEVGDDAMVIALEMCGICGTDKHTYRGETDPVRRHGGRDNRRRFRSCPDTRSSARSPRSAGARARSSNLPAKP